MVLKTIALLITLNLASSYVYSALRDEVQEKKAILAVSKTNEKQVDQDEESSLQRKNCCQFFVSFLMHPLRMGSVAPISPNSARLMVVPVKTGDKVLELGCGTGVVTKEIAKKTTNDQIFGVELGQEFIKPLRSLFPGSTIQQGDAKILGKSLLAEHAGTFDVVVSTLPLRCMSSQDYDKVIKSALSMLKENGKLIQITSYLMAPAIADHSKYGLIAELIGRADYFPNPWVVWSFQRTKAHRE